MEYQNLNLTKGISRAILANRTRSRQIRRTLLKLFVLNLFMHVLHLSPCSNSCTSTLQLHNGNLHKKSNSILW